MKKRYNQPCVLPAFGETFGIDEVSLGCRACVPADLGAIAELLESKP